MTDPVAADDFDLPPRSRLAKWLSIGVGVVIALLVFVLATAEDSNDFGSSPLIGRAAPAVEGETTAGESFSLEEQRGKWVVVNFFQTSCIPCVREHPELVDFASAHEQQGDAVVVSVAFSDSRRNVEDFFAEYGGTWPVLATDTGQHAVSFGVAAVPETFLVSPQGVVTSKFIGGVTAADLNAEISRQTPGLT
jgi:cytochrome c biogenesis protein CcmG/thiol:disulfide interchange protein DsbE